MKRLLTFLLAIALLCPLSCLISGCNQNASNNINETQESNDTKNPATDSRTETESNLNSFDFFGLKIEIDKSYNKLSEGHDDSTSAIIFNNGNYTICTYYSYIPDAPYSAEKFADAIYNDVHPVDQELSKKRGTINQTPWMALVYSDGRISSASAFYVKDGKYWKVDILLNESISTDLNEILDIITGWKIT